MNIKSLSSAVFNSVARITLAVILCTVSPCLSLAQQKDESFSLTVELRDPFNPDFQTCIPIRVNEPFRIAWMDRRVKHSIAGVLRPSVSGEYPLEIMISEGEYEGKIGLKGTSKPQLRLEEPFGWGVIISIAYMRYVTLSKEGCK